MSENNGPRPFHPEREIAIGKFRRVINNILTNLSRPLIRKYPPHSCSCSPWLTNSAGDILAKWHLFDFIIMGISPKSLSKCFCSTPFKLHAILPTNLPLYVPCLWRHSNGNTIGFLTPAMPWGTSECDKLASMICNLILSLLLGRSNSTGSRSAIARARPWSVI